ncbi:fumarylacetoacetate hydrolase family protein [hydrocarbon metagenome]|uniref:Fumarylacetoacetate hydrolase family protein n=1 Tax=hydrocarbon metagenome TaxID=938273 RepID=A0A0W8E4Q9_9ZZZZ
MKFVTYFADGEKVGVLVGDRVVPLNGNIDSKFDSMLELIENTTAGLLDKIESMIVDDPTSLSIHSVKLLAPIPYPRRNVICLGKNYAEHAREIKMTKISDTGIPDDPIYFTKMASPAIAHGDEIRFSRENTGQVDYEVELAVVIAREGLNIKPEEAEEYIWGYTIVNDVSARDLQGKHKQWYKGKSLDTFCPMGPAIVHKRAIPFPVELNIQCSINGELRQNSNTSNMIFGLPYIISDLSQGMTLKPGDIICTGTPSGVGMGFEPPRLLKDGDIVECYIEGIGRLVNKVSIIDGASGCQGAGLLTSHDRKC